MNPIEPQPNSTSARKRVVDVMRAEAAAIETAAQAMTDHVQDAVELLLQCRGRVIVTGMGKMGCIARKAVATFCSTGTPAVFLHPAEAMHGDLGIMGDQDVMLFLSNSGETREVLELLPFAARQKIPTIAITAKDSCSLAKRCQAVVLTHVLEEADPISTAPTTSTTVSLAICDALAVSLMSRRGFTKEQFAIFHPGGNLGSKLLVKVADIMHLGVDVPMVEQATTLRVGIQTISEKRQGALFVVDASKKLLGIFTDGDLRRFLEQHSADASLQFLDQPVAELMCPNPKFTTDVALAAEALKLMEDNEISVLPVLGESQQLVGVIHLHDLIRIGLA